MSRPPVADLVLAAAGVALTGLCALVAVGEGFAWYHVCFTLVHAGLAGALLVRSTWRRASFVTTYVLLVVMAAVVYAAPINLGVSPAILCAPLALYKVARHDPPVWA